MLWSIALGSAIGGVLRYLVSVAVQERAGPGFPVGTLVVNTSGSLLLGALIRLLGAPGIAPELRALFTVGLCGGYTTFSTFSFETTTMLERGEYFRGAFYVIASVALSLLAMWIGFLAARTFAGSRGATP